MLKTRKYSQKKQYLINILFVVFTAVLCFISVELIGYRAVALILLMVVSVNAILFDILPVMLSALLSAFIWNFFFIPPILTLHIGTTEDALMFLMYFVIALINAVLTYNIREVERKEREEEDKANAISLYNTILNSLSHELRTPISTIIGAIDTIKDQQSNLSPSNRNELYSEIEIAGNRLNRQVENLLNMSRLEAGFIKPKKDWCDINELIFTVIKVNNDGLNQHYILFNPNENLPLFKVDSGLLEQILHNLLHNATQHTPQGTQITVEVTYNKTHCMIEISDNGNGFPENEIAFVFDKFYRLQHSKTGGTGLGLSIAKGFTEASHGKIIASNNANGGATFKVAIPAEISYLNNLKNE